MRIRKLRILSVHQDKMEDEDISHNAGVCRMLRQSLLEICKNHYTALADMEVDAIICLSAVNSSQQNVVKIHQVLPLENFKNTHSSKNGGQTSKESTFGIARGLQMQIKKRKRLMCRQKHNFRVRLLSGKSESTTFNKDDDKSCSSTSSSRRKMKKSDVTQYPPWEPDSTLPASMDCSDTAANTLLVTRDRQGHILRVSKLPLSSQAQDLSKCRGGNSADENEKTLSPAKENFDVSIKVERFDDEYGDNSNTDCEQTDGEKDPCGQLLEKDDLDPDDTSLTMMTSNGNYPGKSGSGGKVMIYNKELGSIMTGPSLTESEEEPDEEETNDGDGGGYYSGDNNENSNESLVLKREPIDSEYDRCLNEYPPVLEREEEENVASPPNHNTNGVPLDTNCGTKSGCELDTNAPKSSLNDSVMSTPISKFSADYSNSPNSKLSPVKRESTVPQYSSQSLSAVDLPSSGASNNEWDNVKSYPLSEEDRLDEECESLKSGDAPLGTQEREPAVHRWKRKKKKSVEPKFVSLLNKPYAVPSSAGLGSIVSQSQPSQSSPLGVPPFDISTPSDVSTSPLNYNYSFPNQNFDDGDGSKQFLCDKCGTGFASRKSKMRHEKFTCGNHTFECSVCGKFYSRADSKQRHMLKMHGVKMVPSQMGMDMMDMGGGELPMDMSSIVSTIGQSFVPFGQNLGPVGQNAASGQNMGPVSQNAGLVSQSMESTGSLSQSVGSVSPSARPVGQNLGHDSVSWL